MRNSAITALFTLTLLGCSSAEDENSFTCERTDRAGTYFATFETVDGSCGNQNSALIRLDASGDADPSCIVLDQPAWSEGECKLETHQYCAIDAGHNVEGTAVTTQQDEAGDTITGLMTLVVDDGANVLCSGTYRVTATRQ